MDKAKLQELFSRYYNKTATEAERMELMELIQKSTAKELSDLIHEGGENLKIYDCSLSTDAAETIIQNILQTVPVKRISWKKIAAAASLLLLVGLGAYFSFHNNKSNTKSSITSQQPIDTNPGTYKAKLKLADGSTIILDSNAMGKLAQQGNTTIINSNGHLVYNSGSFKPGPEPIFNTVITNNGETYSLILADGSKVWLNAASSVTFPVAFPGKERKIEIKGEVYIEVAKNAAQPFIVSVNGMEVRALGTEFDINAYPDEATLNTTLIEGSVKVSKAVANTLELSGGQSLILKPGQQAQVTKNNIVVESVNTDEIISWKEGWFHFESADLKTILRQFARWYDIEVVYEGPIISRRFFGIVKRNSTLMNVLEMLKDNNIKFRVEGKRLYVTSG